MVFRGSAWRHLGQPDLAYDDIQRALAIDPQNADALLERGILREKGFTVCAQRSHPPVRDRMNVMNRHFRSADGRVLATVDPRCVRSIEAYERLVFREGTGEPDKMQGFDHLVDASGYYLFGRQSRTSSASTSSFMER